MTAGLLNATDVRVSDPLTTAHGATAVTVAAMLPPDNPEADSTPRVVRSAFLRFPPGPLVELTLHAKADDASAEAEFRRLLESARPAAVAPLQGVAQAIAAGPLGRPDQPAGAVRLDLGPDYRAPTHFLVASMDGAERYVLEPASVAEKGPTREAVVGTLLSPGAADAPDETGRPVRYEAGLRPRLSPGRRPATPAVALELLGGEAPPAPTAAPGEAVVDGSVHGAPVRVTVAAPVAGVDPREMGEQLLRELNQTP
jgi:hypothetical protein